MKNDTLWYKNAIFYELHIRAFCDSNGDGKGDIPGIISKLDYLNSLGVDCLWLLPMFLSPLKDDGYDVADYFHIHPDYGTVDDFRRLVEKAHARGMRVIADLVLNHTSDEHPWFIESRKSKDNPFRDYYVWSDSDQKYSDARIIFLDTETSNWTFDPHTGEYYWHRFYAGQPDLNYDNPKVAQQMMDVLRFWLNIGIDGFRADAVPYLFEREGTTCENLPETHAYLKKVRAMMDAEYPGTILLGEANQLPRDLRPYFGGDEHTPTAPGDEFHMAFHFPLMPRIFKAFKTMDNRDIIQILENTPKIPNNAQWGVFLRNHDELTLEMVTEEDRQFMWREYAPDPRMKLNLGIRRRLAPLLDNDRRKIEAANALLFSLPGAPIIYYGDEIGMGDNLALFDRNGVRTPMQWTAEPGAGFSTADPARFYEPLIDDDTFGYRQVNVAAQQADPGSLWHAMQKLIAVRKMHPVFGNGELLFMPHDNPAVLAFFRRDATETLLVLVNLSAQQQPALFATNDLMKVSPYDIVTGEPVAIDKRGSLWLQPYQFRWLHIG